MAEVMLVDADRLPETPRAFQDYVATFFTPQIVLGKRVFVATRYLELTERMQLSRGRAPSHSIHLQRFRDGLRNTQDLGDWMRKAEGKYLWTFEGGHDSDNVTHLD